MTTIRAVLLWITLQPLVGILVAKLDLFSCIAGMFFALFCHTH